MMLPETMTIVTPDWLIKRSATDNRNAYRTILVGIASPVTSRGTVFLHTAELSPEQLKDWKQCHMAADIVVDYGTTYTFDRMVIEKSLHDIFPGADIYCYGDNESNLLNPWLRISAAQSFATPISAAPHIPAQHAAPAPELAVA